MEFLKALPVWPDELREEMNILIRFSGEINFDGEKCVFHAGADNFYRLFINGKFIHYGPERCGKGFWRDDILDISAHLKKGKNTVDIDVIHYGALSYYYVFQPAFLQAEITLDEKPVLWTDINGGFTARRNLSKLQKVQRFSFQRPMLEAYSLPFAYSDNLKLDITENVRYLDRGAPYPDYTAVYPNLLCGKYSFIMDKESTSHYNYFGFENEKRKDVCYGIDELVRIFSYEFRAIKETEKTEIDTAIDHSYVFSLKGNQSQRVKFSHESCGLFSFNITAKEKSEIFICYCEVLENGSFNALHGDMTQILPITVDKGRHEFLGMEMSVANYVQIYCLSGQVEIEDFHIVEYKNPEAKTAVFVSDDDALNRVFEAARETFAQNAADNYTDCPSRERAGWLCDSFFEARVEKDFTGSSKIEHDYLENFIIATDFPLIPKGMLPMCYPANAFKGSGFIPNWAMWYVIQLEEYYKRSLDADLINRAKERVYALKKYFDGFKGKYGLLQKLDGWVFVEWSMANKLVQDINFPSNMLYCKMLKAMAYLYNDSSLSAEAEEIKENIIKYSYNGKFFTDNAMLDEKGDMVKTNNTTEVCQYYAFFCDIADKQSFPELLRIITEDFGPGHKCEKTHPGVYPANAFIGNYLRFEILSEYGYCKQLISEIGGYFDYMAKITGTLWEHDSDKASCNHGFASHVVRVIFRDILGVANVDEQNQVITLKTDFAPPDNATAKLPLKNGMLEITVKDGVRTITAPSAYTVV